VKARAARDAALAYAVLASVLLREGDLSAARVASEKAGNYLSKCSDREAELKVAMSTARVRALAGGLARDAVTKSFQEIASKADRLGFVPYELEPRLCPRRNRSAHGRSRQMHGAQLEHCERRPRTAEGLSGSRFVPPFIDCVCRISVVIGVNHHCCPRQRLGTVQCCFAWEGLGASGTWKGFVDFPFFAKGSSKNAKMVPWCDCQLVNA
jgi:hypothetical protein